MSATAVHPTPAPFDEIAAIYDEVFTHSLIGQAQRKSVWKEIDRIWKPGDHVLELNCGTGEDALHLAEKGIMVTGCDASSSMIDVARKKTLHRRPVLAAKLAGEAVVPNLPVHFVTVPNEHIGRLSPARPFDGVFSNFSGLNCVADLPNVAGQLANLLRPSAELALVFSTRFSLWEFFWYALRGELAKATRRWPGHLASSLSSSSSVSSASTVASASRRWWRQHLAAAPNPAKTLDVWYPRVPKLRRAFAPYFQFLSVSGIGVAIPPSYVESWAQQHRRTFVALAGIDKWINHLPCLRVAGDHMLLRFRRSS
jgi:SAM-dependent methyltransferase